MEAHDKKHRITLWFWTSGIEGIDPNSEAYKRHVAAQLLDYLREEPDVDATDLAAHFDRVEVPAPVRPVDVASVALTSDERATICDRLRRINQTPDVEALLAKLLLHA